MMRVGAHLYRSVHLQTHKLHNHWLPSDLGSRFHLTKLPHFLCV